MAGKHPIWRIALPLPLRRLFDYRAPARSPSSSILGHRVRVPLHKGSAVGIVCATAGESAIAEGALKRVEAVLDDAPVLPEEVLSLLEWAAAYYQHPIGEVIANALPAWLRQGKPAAVRGIDWFRLSADGLGRDPETLKRAPRQAVLLKLLRDHDQGLSAGAIDDRLADWRPVARRLVDKGWVIHEQRPCLGLSEAGGDEGPPLNPAQHSAVESIAAGLERFAGFVLDGVTGSGKTEVYLRLVERALAAGRQALILVPEIGLTPQLLERFSRRFAGPIAVLHSGLNDQERLCAWSLAKSGAAPVVIGTRSAVFVPLARPGIVVVDEEHDLSYKQQEGFRYHARDLAVMRARRLDIPVVLGSATPSLESLHNAGQGRYQRLELPQRAGAARMPALKVVDLRGQTLQDSLSPPLIATMREHLERNGQVLLFLNRRGFAPTLLCHDCGWVARCLRCDSHMTLYQSNRRLRCHHCGAERAVDAHCPDCASEELRPVGYGTERTEQALQRLFPDTGIVRIDRDSTRRKGAMADLLGQVQDGRARILVGTQMLAKGHHFPQVTLVGIVNVDQGLFSVDFRATERMAQLIVQVAGRAGRMDQPGEVLIQTHHPDHPLLQTLLAEGYAGFARAALDERRATGWPPYSYLAMLRAESTRREQAMTFLGQAAEALPPERAGDVLLLGPVPAPMEKRAGRYRAQLLIQADSRARLQACLADWIPGLESLKAARRVRWSVDVDPVELY